MKVFVLLFCEGVPCLLFFLTLMSSTTWGDVRTSHHQNHTFQASGGLTPPDKTKATLPVDNNSNHDTPDEDGEDRMLWKTILSKYSTTGDRLTPLDVVRVVKSLSKCDSNKWKDESAASCDQLSLTLRINQTFNDISSFNKVLPKLIFLLGEPNCCIFKVEEIVRANAGLSKNANDESDNMILDGSPDDEQGGKLKKEKPSPSEVWGYGILCVTLISMSSLAGVSVMPFMKKAFYKHLLTAMIGLAVGSLTGSAVFHLIPQAFALADYDPSHDYLYISLMVCGGIWLFFMTERILKFVADYNQRKEKRWKREKFPSATSSTPENSAISSMLVENGNCIKDSIPPEAFENHHPNGMAVGTLACGSGGGDLTEPNENEIVYECQEQAIKASFGHQERPRLTSCHDHSIQFEQGKDSVIATVAYMIIFGDGLHNFIDGLSIGAAFNQSILTGVSISVAVMCEELPHELGDFAVLLNAGMSIRQALIYNFLSACTCYIGLAVGIFLGGVQASTYIFALAGGMFLYIALVDMVPEMNETAEETSKISLKKGIGVLLLQNLGIFIGITALFVLAMNQDNINF